MKIIELCYMYSKNVYKMKDKNHKLDDKLH